MQDFFTIITAGGKGVRMGHATPKQFLPIGKKPILMHSIDAFASSGILCKIFLVLPKGQIEYWQQLCKTYSFTTPHEIVLGGKERFFSVKNALEKIPAYGITAIHDGVRPLVSKKTIVDCYKMALEKSNAIPYKDLTESIRKVSQSGSQSVNRADFKLIATPQMFDSNIIKQAYNQKFSPTFTDSASVAESAGVKINLVKTNPENIKITSPMDLALAEILIKEMA